jgi:hypothetical protein
VLEFEPSLLSAQAVISLRLKSLALVLLAGWLVLVVYGFLGPLVGLTWAVWALEWKVFYAHPM